MKEPPPPSRVLVDVRGLNHEHLRALARQHRKTGVIAEAAQRVGQALEQQAT